MPLTDQERQAVIERLKTYPQKHGFVWGTGDLRRAETAQYAADMIYSNPGLVPHG